MDQKFIDAFCVLPSKLNGSLRNYFKTKMKMKLSERITKLRGEFINLPPTLTEEFDSVCSDVQKLEGTIPYEIKIDASEIEEVLKKFADKLEETYSVSVPIKEILYNAAASRDLAQLIWELSDNGYSKKYSNWDNWLDNFKSYSLKTDSGVEYVRAIINGMINEIKRLEKENEALKYIGK